MAVLVKVIVSDQGAIPAPVEDVTVDVYSDGDDPLFSSVTDVNGEAEFTLSGAADPGTEYLVRAYKVGYRAINPFLIEVLEPVGDAVNEFDISIQSMTDPEPAVDERLCRVTFLAYDASAEPVEGARARFHLTRDPSVLSNVILLTTEREVETDANGIARIDLVRGGNYSATVSGFEEGSVLIHVPNRSSAYLSELLYPWAVGVESDSSVELTEVAPVVESSIVVTMSDGTEASSAVDVISVESSDEDVVTVEVTPTMLVFTRVGPGDASVVVYDINGPDAIRQPDPTALLTINVAST